jgi:WD40 repeat protein
MHDGRHAITTSFYGTTIWDLVDACRITTVSYLPDRGLVGVTQDGQRALVATTGGMLLYDLSDSKQWNTAALAKPRAGALAVSPLTECAVLSLEDGTSQVWDLSRFEQTATLRGHASGINGVSISSDGRYAVTASDDTTLRVWDLHTFNEVAVLQGHSERVNAVAVTPDCSRIISGAADDTVRVWDIHERCQLKVLSGHTGPILKVLITRDGRRALTAEIDNVFVWDLATYQELARLHSYVDVDSTSPPYAPIRNISLSADGRYVLVACDDAGVGVIDWPAVSVANESKTRIWDLTTYAEVRQLIGTAGAITSNGRLALTATGSTLLLWDLTSTDRLILSGHAGDINQVMVSPDDTFVVSTADDLSLLVWDLKSQTPTASFTADEHLLKVVITPNARIIIATGNGGTIYFLVLE